MLGMVEGKKGGWPRWMDCSVVMDGPLEDLKVQVRQVAIEKIFVVTRSRH